MSQFCGQDLSYYLLIVIKRAMGHLKHKFLLRFVSLLFSLNHLPSLTLEDYFFHDEFTAKAIWACCFSGGESSNAIQKVNLRDEGINLISWVDAFKRYKCSNAFFDTEEKL